MLQFDGEQLHTVWVKVKMFGVRNNDKIKTADFEISSVELV